MDANDDYLDKLKAAILIEHRRAPTHTGTYYVQESTSSGETVWEGNVEAFNLSGNGQSKTCYAWQHADLKCNLKIFAVLENQFIDSPSKAVQAALFMDAQPPVHPYSNSFESLKRLLAECKDRIRKIAMAVENLDDAIETVGETRELIAQKHQPVCAGAAAE